MAHGLDESGEPVDREPTFTGGEDLTTRWLRISPLCEQVEIRVVAYDAQGRPHNTQTLVNPGEYGVDCIGRYTCSSQVYLRHPGQRPTSAWWLGIYINDVLSCTLLFEME